MGNSIHKLSYGQVAIFTKQCYGNFVNSGGAITSFNKKNPVAKKPVAGQSAAEVPQIFNVTGSSSNTFTVPFTFIALGPRTRVRLYSNKGNFVIENSLYDDIKIVDCNELSKDVGPVSASAPLNIWISVYGDVNRPIEAFDIKNTCNNLCNSLTFRNILILILIILIIQIIYSKRKNLFC